MKLENQVCTLEQARRLKKLGVAYESIFRYVSDHKGEFECVLSWGYEWSDYPCHAGSNEIISAYTVAELGAMLPNGVGSIQNINCENYKKPLYPPNKWRINGNCLKVVRLSIKETRNSYDTEAQARAAMLIYLLENNLTTAEEVNQRLQTA